ncbi:MAG: OmpP1/FadL family transporter [Candidatus Aminicenantaceae bacterium]
MKKITPIFTLSLLFGLLIILPHGLWSQLVIGQYEDEAPFRTWNMWSTKTASSLALGNTHSILTSDCSVALSNPALLLNLPPITFTLSSSFETASFFKYAFVNTGVIDTEKSAFHGFFALDFAGISVRLNEWAIALNWSQVESYERPKAEQQYQWRGQVYYFLKLSQMGSLRNLNFSISRMLTKRLSAGIGFNFVYGNFEKLVTEKWVMDDITITDNKTMEFSGFCVNGGISLWLTERFHVAASFRTPYVKKSESQSLLRYYSPAGNTDIKTEALSEDKFKMPLIIGFGSSYKISEKLRGTSEFTFYNWSQYSIDYFGEHIERSFKNILKIGLGFEHVSSVKLGSKNIITPFRVGLSYDPQPMKEYNSSYFYFTLGSGFQFGRFILDIGSFVGLESGSGNSLKATKVAGSLSYQL